MILLELGRPLEAAAAFRAASRLSPSAPLYGSTWPWPCSAAAKPSRALQVLDDLEKTASGPLRQQIEALRRRINRG